MQQLYVYVFGFRWSEWKWIAIFRLNFCVVSVFPLIESFDIFLFSSVQRVKKPGGLRKIISAQLWGEKRGGTHHDIFSLISSPDHVTVANEMFPHFPWEWKFVFFISPLRYEEHSKCRNEAAESKPCRPSRAFTEPFLWSFFQSTSVLSTSSGWHRQQEWKMVTSLKNKTNLWLNYLQSRRYHLARCAKSSFSYISLNRRGKVGKFAALETRRGPEHQACATDETKIWLSRTAKQRRNPCSGSHLCTRIWLCAMFSSLKKSYCRVANHYERKFATCIRQ